MNETEALVSQLRDVHTPSVSAMPALGWWLLALGIVLMCLLAWLFYHRARGRVWQKQARAELALLRSEIGKEPLRQTLPAVSRLVRRVALVARPRHEIASLHGVAWLKLLDEICGRAVFSDSFGQLLETGPYQKNLVIADGDMHALLDQVDELISAAAKSSSSA